MNTLKQFPLSLILMNLIFDYSEKLTVPKTSNATFKEQNCFKLKVKYTTLMTN